MDETRARRLLAALAAEAGDEVLLWRGSDLTGSDLDLLVRAGSRDRLDELLEREGLVRRDDGHWASPDGELVVDPLDERDWPHAYPSAAGVCERAEHMTQAPPIAAPVDRVLIFAAEAVAGRPLSKLVPKLRALAAEREVMEDALALAGNEGAVSLARLAADPDRLEHASVRGALSYRVALAAGIRSRRGRAALRTRLAATFERRLRRAGRPPRPRAA